MKKVLSIILTLVLLVSALPLNALSVKAEKTSGYYTYTVAGGEASIISCDTSISGDITIPSFLGGYPVTGIFQNAFYYCVNITSITIPESILLIDYNAFTGCLSLLEINVVSDNKYYSSLDGILFDKYQTEVILYPSAKTDTIYSVPKGVKRIGYGSFDTQYFLNKIILPNGVEYIDPGAFQSCYYLEEITIPNTVERIGYAAFYLCSSLTTVNYQGSRYQWEHTVIEYLNDPLKQADISFKTSQYDNYTTVYKLIPSYTYALAYVQPIFSVPDVGYKVSFDYYLASGDVCVVDAQIPSGEDNWPQDIKTKSNDLEYGVHCFESSYHYSYYGCNVYGWQFNSTDTVLYVWNVRIIDELGNEQFIYPITIGGTVSEYHLDLSAANGLYKVADRYFYFLNGEVDTSYTGLYKLNSTWYYVSSGVVPSKGKALVKHSGGWYYAENGVVDFSFTGLAVHNGNRYYVKDGKVDFTKTGLVKHNGEWYYVVDGRKAKSYTGLVKHSGAWYYIEEGDLASDYTGLVKYNGVWYYVNRGKLNKSYTGLAKYNNYWYYIKDGKLTTDKTGLVKHSGAWYYVKNSKMDTSFTSLYKHSGAWYYIKAGKLASSYNGLVKYQNAWYYVKNGKVDFTYSGGVIYNGITYTVKNGKKV